MIRDIFSHPFGWCCSAVCVLVAAWIVLAVYRKLFPTNPPMG